MMASLDQTRGSHNKVFCIGLNKTGTTSIEAALQGLGYRMGSQVRGELLLRNWLARDFGPIIQFAESADAFQDIPFSLPFTFQALACAFPEAKLVLSIRSSAEEWYDSLVRFNSVDLGRLPTAEELKLNTYRYPGFMYEAQVGTVMVTDDDLFERQAHLDFYNAQSHNVTAYFRNSNRLLVINIGELGSYQKFCEYLGREPVLHAFPHLNATIKPADR